MACLEVMEEALEGDGSTGTMPDVSPSDAARWILSNLIAKGYRIERPPLPPCDDRCGPAAHTADCPNDRTHG